MSTLPAGCNKYFLIHSILPSSRFPCVSDTQSQSQMTCNGAYKMKADHGTELLQIYNSRYPLQLIFTGGSLKSPSGCFWLFSPKFWEVTGTYELSFYSKRNTASVVLAICGGGDTQTLLDRKNKLNFMWWRCKRFFSYLPSASATTSVP